MVGESMEKMVRLSRIAGVHLVCYAKKPLRKGWLLGGSESFVAG